MQFAPLKLIESLIKQGVSKDQANKIVHEVEARIQEEAAPRIALMGLTGVGKSSTVNALFDAGREIGDVLPCTKEPGIIHTSIADYNGAKGPITVYDMPGLGEDMRFEAQYLEEYSRLVPEVDVAVWIIDAGDRAVAPIQRSLVELVNRHGRGIASKFVIAINKVDSTAPGELEWNRQLNVPSKSQADNIEEFEQYIRSGIAYALPGWNGAVLSYSARQRYHLAQLINAMIEAVPQSRQWVLNERTCLADYEELIDSDYLAYIKEEGVLR